MKFPIMFYTTHAQALADSDAEWQDRLMEQARDAAEMREAEIAAAVEAERARLTEEYGAKLEALTAKEASLRSEWDAFHANHVANEEAVALSRIRKAVEDERAKHAQQQDLAAKIEALGMGVAAMDEANERRLNALAAAMQRHEDGAVVRLRENLVQLNGRVDHLGEGIARLVGTVGEVSARLFEHAAAKKSKTKGTKNR